MAIELQDYHDSIMSALDTHEAKSQARADAIKHEIHKHSKGEKMSEVNNIFKGHGMGDSGLLGGGGLAAGGLGGLILRAYLADALTESQQVWLSRDMQRNPSGVLEFAGTDAGKAVIRAVVDAYRKWSESK